MNTLQSRRRGALYGRRKGPKLSAHQSALFETLLPQLELKLDPGRDPRAYFEAAVDDVWLEIGFGGGEHLLWQAEHHPHVGVIGAEPYRNGVAKLLAKISVSESAPSTFLPRVSRGGGGPRSGGGGISRAERPPPPLRDTSPTLRAGEEKNATASRVRIYEGDAREIVAALPDASLGRVFLLFPDPWPKKRHHKRRFIQTETLAALARVMKPGAEFRFASDDENYIAWTLERVLAHDAFDWPATRAQDWQTRPSDWPPTRYEEKALRGPPVFLRFLRRDLQKALAKRT